VEVAGVQAVALFGSSFLVEPLPVIRAYATHDFSLAFCRKS
jgi:hypothetical protein